MKQFLKVAHEDRDMYRKYGAKARMYLHRLNISRSLMVNEDFSHDWLTEFAWKELDSGHKLIDGLRNLKQRYDYLRKERLVETDGNEVFSDKS